MTLVVVGHLGFDVTASGQFHTQHLGGSLFHFLNGFALSGGACRVVTWTSREVEDEAIARLPPRVALDVIEVASPPRFEAIYSGESLSEFRIHDIEMPDEAVESVRGSTDLHLTAMPFADLSRVLVSAQPRSWSLQLHSSVLPAKRDFQSIVAPPTRVFCNADEFAATGNGAVMPPSVEWVITQRDKVEVYQGGNLRSSYIFEAAQEIIEATGAGDVFAGAVTGAKRRGIATTWAVRFGVGAAALAVSAPSSEAFASWWSDEISLTRLAAAVDREPPRPPRAHAPEAGI